MKLKTFRKEVKCKKRNCYEIFYLISWIFIAAIFILIYFKGLEYSNSVEMSLYLYMFITSLILTTLGFLINNKRVVKFVEVK